MCGGLVITKSSSEEVASSRMSEPAWTEVTTVGGYLSSSFRGRRGTAQRMMLVSAQRRARLNARRRKEPCGGAAVQLLHVDVRSARGVRCGGAVDASD